MLFRSILLLLTGVSAFISILALKKTQTCCELKVSDKQSDYINPLQKETQEEAYTELMGFGCLELDADAPFIYLINPPENEVYLSFDVLYEKDTLYHSDLIAPGKMEDFDVYSYFDAGEYTLNYLISSYDLKNKEVLWSGVQQNQDILIKK